MNKTTLRNRILNNIPYDIHCGKHSGFPNCCIIFFITQWAWMSSNKKQPHWDKMNKLRNHPGYIPCPKCLRNRDFIKVKLCPKNCQRKILLFGKNWKKHDH